jgi:RHS repeat-associated protein
MPRTARAGEAGYGDHVLNRGSACPDVVHQPADDATFPQAARERADRLGTVGDFVDNGGGGGGRADYGAFGGAGFGFAEMRYEAAAGPDYVQARWYDLATGRFVSRDPIGSAAGDANLYRYVANEPTVDTDPSGLSPKARVVGWVVRRAGNQLIRVQSIYSEKQAARLFLGKCAREGLDILLREGRQQAHKVARTIQGQMSEEARRLAGEILEGGAHAAGHPIRNLLGRAIGTGRPHIQFDGIPGRHIFYGLMAAAIAASAGSAAQAAGDYSLDITEVYSNPYPGDSIAHALTLSYWCGEDSWLSYGDWLNPFELVAISGDFGRAIDREMGKELIGHTITVRDEQGQPLKSFTFSPNGELMSVANWNGTEIGEVIKGLDYLNSL